MRTQIALILALAQLSCLCCGAGAVALTQNITGTDDNSSTIADYIWLAGGFQTDTQEYSLGAVTLRLDVAEIHPTYTASLWSWDLATGFPGSQIAFFAPNPLPGVPYTRNYTFRPTNVIVLAPSTRYFVVIGTTERGDAVALWRMTLSSDVGPGTIFNQGSVHSQDLGNTWFRFDNGTAYMMSIEATPRRPLCAGFCITSFKVQPNSVTIIWRAQPGETYYIDFKAALADPKWTPVSGGIIAQGTVASWTGLRAPGAASAFYRVVQLGD